MTSHLRIPFPPPTKKKSGNFRWERYIEFFIIKIFKSIDPYRHITYLQQLVHFANINAVQKEF